MSGIYDWYKWISEHSEDKRDLTPQLPTHPVPSYVAEADENEHEAWQDYIRVVEQELESEKDDPDYERLQQAKGKWEQVADAQLAARHRWNEERYGVKSHIANLLVNENKE